MKKNSIIIVMVILLCGVVGFSLLHQNQAEEKNPFPVSVSGGELLAESKEVYHGVKVYQLDKQLVINAESESEFFEGAQFTAEASRKLSPSDVKITWTTASGSTKGTEKDQLVIAQIKIQEGEKVIFDQR